MISQAANELAAQLVQNHMSTSQLSAGMTSSSDAIMKYEDIEPDQPVVDSSAMVENLGKHINQYRYHINTNPLRINGLFHPHYLEEAFLYAHFEKKLIYYGKVLLVCKHSWTLHNSVAIQDIFV